MNEERRWKYSVRPNLIVVSSGRNSQKSQWRKKPERREHSGSLSYNSRRKLKNAIRWLIATSQVKKVYEKKLRRTVEYKINMCTLTFKHNMQEDNIARKILSKWLEMAKYRWSLEHYIWKAEPQERGAIHFHLSSGVYLPYKEVCYTWNRLLGKVGFPQVNANSTDVHAVIGVKNHEAYLTEYFLNESKHEGRRKITGRLWGCSQGIARAGKEIAVVSDVEKRAMYEDLKEYHLANRMKVIPDFLNFIDVYCLPDGFFDRLPPCQLKDVYARELVLLSPTVRQKEFWCRDQIN